MERATSWDSGTPANVCVPPLMDRLVEEMVLVERRKKVTILTMALEEYAAKYHPALVEKMKAGPSGTRSSVEQ